MSTPKIAEHVPLIHTPDFWKPELAYSRFRPDLASAYLEGAEYARTHGLATAQALKNAGIANLLMCTDLQDDFRDDGRLAVKGTDTVILRVCARLLNGIVTDHYTGVTYSLDGHPHQHISYSVRWRGTDGRPFDLRVNKAAILTLVDRNKAIFQATCFSPVDGSPIDMGYVQSYFDARDTVEYWDHLQATGQGPIWVFDIHCALGSDGMALHPLFQLTLAFAAGARAIMPGVLSKGHLVDRDWFGPLVPCMIDTSHPQGGFQTAVIDDFKGNNTVDFVGIAEDFCQHHMERQTLEQLADTEFVEKLQFVLDGTAPIVPNAPHVAELRERARAAGVTFINHDTPFKNAS